MCDSASGIILLYINQAYDHKNPAMKVAIANDIEGKWNNENTVAAKKLDRNLF